ncbi:hypothetical protein J3R83DRAFT_748 [Lanmaoa asiatica]|nr:hypothetical protein J3R83DRAFT_748 [Lanmaoa asiatica]
MIYGRVIGNELRDVPPECANIYSKLPIWGQRWSGHRAPRGPSPFSTRIFSVDRMSEIGPALTSPTQFEVTLTEEDEGEETNSESSRLYNTSPLSPLAIQTDATELTFRRETPAPRSVQRSSSHPHGSPKILHRNTGDLPLQNSTCFTTTLFPRRQSEQSRIQHHASEPLLHPPALHHGTPIQGDRGSFENNYTLWDIDRPSTSNQPQAGPFHGSYFPTGQLQYAMPPHSIYQWQFANAYTQSSAYPGSGYLLQPFQADDKTRFIPTTPPSSSHSFTTALPQQIFGIDSSWNHESSTTMIPGIAHPRNPMISQWPSGSVPLNPSFPGSLQNSESSLGPGVSYHLVSDHHRNSSHTEDLLGTFAHPEG